MKTPILVETCADIEQALKRISRAGLCDDDETRSQVQLLLTHDRAMVRQVWLVTDPETGNDIGMAMLSDPTGNSQGLPVLNLFVGLGHRERGVGRSLVDEVLKTHDANGVAAYYTTMRFASTAPPAFRPPRSTSPLKPRPCWMPAVSAKPGRSSSSRCSRSVRSLIAWRLNTAPVPPWVSGNAYNRPRRPSPVPAPSC